MNPHLKSALKRLKLSGLLSTLEVRLQEAAVNQLSCAEFLELIVNDEISHPGGQGHCTQGDRREVP